MDATSPRSNSTEMKPNDGGAGRCWPGVEGQRSWDAKSHDVKSKTLDRSVATNLSRLPVWILSAPTWFVFSRSEWDGTGFVEAGPEVMLDGVWNRSPLTPGIIQDDSSLQCCWSLHSRRSPLSLLQTEWTVVLVTRWWPDTIRWPPPPHHLQMLC